MKRQLGFETVEPAGERAQYYHYQPGMKEDEVGLSGFEAAQGAGRDIYGQGQTKRGEPNRTVNGTAFIKDGLIDESRRQERADGEEKAERRKCSEHDVF